VRELATDVWHLDGLPPNTINVYMLGDVLVDAGTVFAKRRILRQLRDRVPAAHALTHAHPDHFGSSHAICEALGIPLWCGAGDVAAVEAGRMVGRGGRMLPGPHAHHVSRVLREGDEVAGFTILDVPGHSPGHIAFWRESDRTLICGDVMFGPDPLTGRPREPLRVLSADPRRNRESARRLASLDPALVCFGHGAPLRDPAVFRAAVERLG
jgi:hydroxyacylglutathione hydrolase